MKRILMIAFKWEEEEEEVEVEVEEEIEEGVEEEGGDDNMVNIILS
jgi:hypothetical protein